MKRLLTSILTAIASLLIINTSSAQLRSLTKSIHSVFVNTEYEIEIVLPADYREDEKYTIVYCTDWFQISGFMEAIVNWLEFGGKIDNIILIGISIEHNSKEWSFNRYRDFTPSRSLDDYTIKYTYTPALGHTGGAEKFLLFLSEELIPFVESEYHSDSSKRGFIGYSLGGLFGVYTLIHDPGLFHNYLIGSPSLWWNSYSILKNKNGFNLEKEQYRIYISLGEKEDNEMKKGFREFSNMLGNYTVDPKFVKKDFINDEGHASGLPFALYNGFRYLFQNK